MDGDSKYVVLSGQEPPLSGQQAPEVGIPLLGRGLPSENKKSQVSPSRQLHLPDGSDGSRLRNSGVSEKN
jgi:hypothetical protein